jgi:hypothetical protein
MSNPKTDVGLTMTKPGRPRWLISDDPEVIALRISVMEAIRDLNGISQ